MSFITNATRIFRRLYPNQNALSTLGDVNTALENFNSSNFAKYFIPTASAELTGVNSQIAATSDVTNYSKTFATTIEASATNAMTAVKKLIIADIGSQGANFAVTNITINFGNAVIWDGGDFKVYLGDSLLGTIPAATLIAVGPLAAASFNVPVASVYSTGSGTYSSVTGTSLTEFTELNLRLTAETVTFVGTIGVYVTVQGLNAKSCGTWCNECNTPAKIFIKCAYADAIKCTECPGGSFSATDVINA